MDLEALFADGELDQLGPHLGTATDAQRTDWLLQLGGMNVAGAGQFAQRLLDAGAAIDARGACGETPLHVAAFYRQLAVSIALLSRGADAEAKTSARWFINEVSVPVATTPRDLFEAELSDALEHDQLAQLEGWDGLASALGTTLDAWVSTVRNAKKKKKKR